MKVYYNASLGGRPRGKAGKRQVLNWSFNHLGKKRIIPCVYRFKKGIVFDIITPLDEAELNAFIKKNEEISETGLSENQRRQLEQEHPYKEVSVAGIWINGKRVRDGYSSTGDIRMPFFNDNKDLKVIKNAYKRSLGQIDCFAYQRFCVPYPKEANSRRPKRRGQTGDFINALKFITHENQRFYPIEQQFQLSEVEKTKEIKFQHPTMQVQHTLYFQIEEAFELPEEVMWGEKLYATSAVYEVVPPLNEKERLEFDSTLSYKRKPINFYAPESTNSIGIIGGASGPTSIFLAEKRGELPTCFSKISADKEESAKFILKGIHIMSHPQQCYEYYNKGYVK